MTEDERRGLVAARTRAATQCFPKDFPVWRTISECRGHPAGAFPFSPSGARRSDLSAPIFPHPWLKQLPLAVWSLRRPIFGFAYGSLCSAVAKFFLIRKATHQPHKPYQTPTPQLESPRAYSAIRYSPFSASPEHNPPNHPCEKQTHSPPHE